MKADQLDSTKYDLYTSYAYYNDYLEDEAEAMLDWVRNHGKGLLMVGDVMSFSDKAKYHTDIHPNR